MPEWGGLGRVNQRRAPDNPAVGGDRNQKQGWLLRAPRQRGEAAAAAAEDELAAAAEDEAAGA
jgi:hypothetical protein